MRIFINTKFEGIHKYQDAPEEVSFLRFPHRHMFGVRVEMNVTHDDRELEFIIVKRKITSWLSNSQLNNKSCEQIGKDIIMLLLQEYGSRDYVVTIDEDGENGAVVSEFDL